MCSYDRVSSSVGQALKHSTGIVGLGVVPNAREVLIQHYEKTLDMAKAIPPHAVYRQAIEKVCEQQVVDLTVELMMILLESRSWCCCGCWLRTSSASLFQSFVWFVHKERKRMID